MGNINRMWKKLDLEQFLEKHGQNLNPQKPTKKIKNHSKSSRFSSNKEPFNIELDLILKKCRYCQNEIPIKDYKNHIDKTCEKVPYLRDVVISEEEIQISTIVRKLNKPLPLIISLLRGVGLDVSTEQEYVAKMFADSLWLVFNSKTKEPPSFKTESEEVSKNSIENHNETGVKENKGIKFSKSNSEKYKKCPLCSTNIESEENDLYFLEKCPKHVLKEIKQHQLEKQIKIVEKKDCPYCLVSVNVNNFEIHINEKCPKNSNKFNISKPNLSVEKLSWTLLPKGEWLFNELTKHFKQLNSTKKWRNKSFDEARLQKIEETLKPNKCFVGNDEFEGYIVYCFDWTDKAILECPIYGNAIYIIRQGKCTWQEIAKASKWEARTEHSEQVTVINHSETWLERLEQNLRYGF